MGASSCEKELLFEEEYRAAGFLESVLYWTVGAMMTMDSLAIGWKSVQRVSEFCHLERVTAEI